MATSTFPCDCCKCDYVNRLTDCCTEEAVNIAVCSGLSQTTLFYNGRCYSISETNTLTADAVSAGWTILNHTQYTLLMDGCLDDNCMIFYQVWQAFCGNYEEDRQSPYIAVTGPCDNRADAETNAGYYAEINGRWYANQNIWAVRKCDGLPASGVDDVYYELIDTECYEATEETIPYCCTECVVSGEWPNATVSYHLRPQCITISGFAFSGCGTYEGELPEWDGKLFCGDEGMYAGSVSYGPCNGNWDTCRGYIPGTTVGLAGGGNVWWSCEDGIWYLDLGFTWNGSGGTDPSDPTGTYTVIGTPGCNGPGTLTVS